MNSKTVYMAKSTDMDTIQNEDVIKIANIRLDPDSRQVQINDQDINLTVMEFELLSYLTASRNRAVSRKELLKEVWGFENIVETRATDDMIKRLRKKLECAGSQLKITTVWGYGFKVEA